VAVVHYGIDVGGTKTKFAVFNDTFSQISSHRVSTEKTDYQTYLHSLRDLVLEADNVYGSQSSVGVGITGILNGTGRSFSVNVPCLNGQHVRNDLAELLGRDICCLNDIDAFALSESQGGAADGFETMVGIILGTGVGSRTCRNGLLQKSVDGVAGEWGHLPISAPLAKRHGLPIFDCSCGQKGCMERYISGPGLQSLAALFLKGGIDSRKCISLMRLGDESAVAVFEIWIELVASVVAQLVLHTNPDVIVIGGGMSGIEELYARLPGVTAQFMLKGISPPPVRPARFGDASGVRGAAIAGATA